ncbi:putative UDP-glucuronic acid decarboxylase 1-like [Capsicum annuum]|nr:putative UDP-glucuronic acid decarboxylase 1-like [Capsicum annuum]
MLKLWNCDDITKIDATNLVSIEYAGFQIPELKLGRESSQMKHSKIVLHCHDYLNAAWFGKLREFLSNSTSWSQVSLHFRGCSRINMNDWQLHHGVATPQVGVLNVYSTWQNEEFPPFMDALLWTCHPKRLNLQLHSTREKVTCFIDRLMYLKNSSQSTSDGSTPWYSQLKQVKTWKNESWHPLEHKSGNPKETDKYYILLNW